MSLFDTFFDAMRIIWKEKPCWRFVLRVFAPLSFVTIFLLFPCIMAVVFSAYGDNGFCNNSIAIPFLLCSLVLMLLLFFISIASLVITQIGSVSIVESMDSYSFVTVNKTQLKQIIKKRLGHGFLYYLVIIGVPLFVYFLLIFGAIALFVVYGNIFIYFALLCIFLIWIPVMFVMQFLYFSFFPIFIQETLTIREKFKQSWLYFKNHAVKILLFSLIALGFLYAFNMIIYIPYYFLNMIFTLGILVGSFLLQISLVGAILVFIMVIMAYALCLVFHAAAIYLAMGAMQLAFALLFKRLQTNDGVMPPLQAAPIEV